MNFYTPNGHAGYATAVNVPPPNHQNHQNQQNQQNANGTVSSVDPQRAMSAAIQAFEQPPAPSLREVLGAYRLKGEGDREMLLAILNAKAAEDQRSAQMAALHQTILQVAHAQLQQQTLASLTLNALAPAPPTPPTSHSSIVYQPDSVSHPLDLRTATRQSFPSSSSASVSSRNAHDLDHDREDDSPRQKPSPGASRGPLMSISSLMSPPQGHSTTISSSENGHHGHVRRSHHGPRRSMDVDIDEVERRVRHASAGSTHSIMASPPSTSSSKRSRHEYETESRRLERLSSERSTS